MPSLIAGARWDTVTTLTADWSVLTWQDSAWANPIFASVRGGGYDPVPVLSLTPRGYLLWLTSDPNQYGGGLLL